jgi:hypothetical protein
MTEDPFVAECSEILVRTPGLLVAWLSGLPPDWVTADEGPGTWSPYDIVGHLVHGEKTDWVTRAKSILTADERPFEPFDRFAMLEVSGGRTLDDLLDELKALRLENLGWLESLALTSTELDLPGLHLDLGPVTLRELLATWVVHDLGHLAQVARVMAKRYADVVGPWGAYLPVLSDRRAPRS